MRTTSRTSQGSTLLWAVFSLTFSSVLAQPPEAAKHVLVLYWDSREFAPNVEFEHAFQNAVESLATKPIEFYSEYLDSTRFPGKSQSALRRDLLKKKFASQPIDVVGTNASPALDFLFENRSSLFPDTPIVFAA